MNAAETKTAIVAALGIFALRDPVRIAELLHEHVEWHGPAGNATAVYLDRPLPMIGRGTVAAFLATGFREMFRDAAVTVSALTVDADRAVVEQRLEAYLPNGRRYGNDYCFVYEFRDGKIWRMREYMDTLFGWKQVFGPGSIPPRLRADAREQFVRDGGCRG
jgi:ketosteroid isomerase-like protein